MGHAGGEQPERRQPLFVLQLALQANAIADVADHQHARVVGDVVGMQRTQGDGHRFLHARSIDEMRFHRSRWGSAQLSIGREE